MEPVSGNGLVENDANSQRYVMNFLKHWVHALDRSELNPKCGRRNRGDASGRILLLHRPVSYEIDRSTLRSVQRGVYKNVRKLKVIGVRELNRTNWIRATGHYCWFYYF